MNKLPTNYNSNTATQPIPCRRSDYHAFLMALPKQKLNPYHIKMEDETYGGNYDENRNFVLSNLTNHKVTSLSPQL